MTDQYFADPTGFNPGMGMGNFNNGMSSPPPLPQQQSPQKDTSPANIFAQMKSGTFAAENAPQDASKYDALRPQQRELSCIISLFFPSN